MIAKSFINHYQTSYCKLTPSMMAFIANSPIDSMRSVLVLSQNGSTKLFKMRKRFTFASTAHEDFHHDRFKHPDVTSWWYAMFPIIDLRAFPMSCLKFKLKFGLRSYFFHFSLPLFKILTSDSLFSTLFH